MSRGHQSTPSGVRIRISEPSPEDVHKTHHSHSGSMPSLPRRTSSTTAAAAPSSGNPRYLRSALKNRSLSVDSGSRPASLARQGSSAGHPSDRSEASTSASTSATALSHGYRRAVAFDTFPSGDEANSGGGTGIHYGFTMQAKSHGYERSKNTRTFLVGTDLNEYSVHALNWLLNNLLESGDEIIVLRVMDPSNYARDPTLSPQAVAQTQEEARDEAHQVLRSILDALPDLSVSIILEFCVGKIQPMIQRMVRLYKPDSLVVGTRGRSESVWRSTFMGSTSKYCLSSSPVPVIVVRPERKVRKSVEARKSRSSYGNLVNDRTKPSLKHSNSNMSSRTDIEDSNNSRAATPTPDSRQASTSDLTPGSSQQSSTGTPSGSAGSGSGSIVTARDSPSNNVRKPSVLQSLNFPEDKELLPKILTMGMWGLGGKGSKELKRSKTAPS